MLIANCLSRGMMGLALVSAALWIGSVAVRGNEIAPRVGDRLDDEASGESTPRSRVGDRGDANPEEKPEAADRADRVREGTRWQNERGVFTLVGDRVTFTRNGQNFVVLENLNLERVVKTIEENRTVTDADTLEWNVDATVTEFRGVNFVLVTRSVLVARPRGSSTTP
jgi:hypothetical protein